MAEELDGYVKEILRHMRDTTIGTGVQSTNKVAHIKKDKIFFFG